MMHFKIYVAKATLPNNKGIELYPCYVQAALLIY